ncbi:MAG: helix-turn-helix domain-containing protein [Thermoplasmata archaeon]
MEYNDISSLIRKFLRNMGLNEAACRIYSILALSERPMSIREISEKTGYSQTMIYLSIRELIENNLVERMKEGKNIAYVANINFIDVFEKKRKKIIEEFLEPIINLDVTRYPENRRIKEIRDYAIKIRNYFNKINELNNLKL